MVGPADKTCASVMNASPPCLRQTDTVGGGLRMLLENQMLGLPVIDDKGCYVGMFLKSSLFSALLPNIAAAGEPLQKIGRVQDLRYMGITIDDLGEKLREIADHPVQKYIDTQTPVMNPDTPLASALLHVHRTRNFLPVVDPRTKEVVGIISTWHVFRVLSQYVKAEAVG